jgi:spore coat protein U-like protein
MRLTLIRFLLALVATLGLAGAAEAGCITGAGAVTFAASSSYDVRNSAVANASGAAGLACSGTLLSLLGGGYARATVKSDTAFTLSNGSNTITYQVAADPGFTKPFTNNGTIDFMNVSLLSLLGINNMNTFGAIFYAKLTSAPNVPAGTYTDVLHVTWDYYICNGIQIGTLCVLYETGTKQVDVTVSVTVSNDCKINAPNVTFGSAPLASGFNSITPSVSIDCTKNATYKVAFTSGNAPSARPWRTMKDSAGNVLQYNIYRTDGATIWDESNPLTSTQAGTGSLTPSQMQSYVAKVNPAQTTPPPGTYTDNVSVVISF